MERILKYINMFSLPQLRISDIIEIFLITFIVYQIIKNLKDTRAWIVVKGLFILFGLYLIAAICSFEIITLIFQGALGVCAFAIVLVFQPELKRFLEDLGNKKISFNLFKKNNRTNYSYYSEKTINELAIAIEEMAKYKTGALIAIEKDIPLTEYINTGIDIKGELSNQLLINIFEKNTPLHDGAVIIRNNKVEAATCLFKLSENPKIDKKFGTRHRAGIGLTETTDAIVIVVSEETGNITFIKDGKYFHIQNDKKLKELLFKYQYGENIEDKIRTRMKTKNKITHNGLLKIFSFVLVICLWIITINVTDPLSNSSYTIPITIINDKALLDAGQTYEPLKNTEVKVNISARRSVLSSIKSENVIAEADLQKISITNAVPLNFYINNTLQSEYTISSKLNSINLKLEELVETELPLEIVTTGNPENGYLVYKTEPVISTVSVTVPSSIAKTLNKAQIKVPLNQENSNFNYNGTPEIYDKNGNTVKNVRNVPSLNVSMYIGKIKDVPIKINVSDDMNKKYDITNISYSPKMIQIVGEEKDVSTMDNVVININTELSEDLNTTIKNFDIPLPENISLVKPEEKIAVSITLNNLITKNIEIPSKQIEIINNSSNLKYSFNTNIVSTEIKGTEKSLEEITISNIQTYIDVIDIKEKGVYSIPLQIKNNNFAFVVPPSITITVTE